MRRAAVRRQDPASASISKDGLNEKPLPSDFSWKPPVCKRPKGGLSMSVQPSEMQFSNVVDDTCPDIEGAGNT
jgi:hypothetical protein